MPFLYKKDVELLKKITRVIGDQVVTFYIIKKRYKFFNGLFQYTENKLVSNYNPFNVKPDDRYKTTMELEAARYSILSTYNDLMIGHLDD